MLVDTVFCLQESRLVVCPRWVKPIEEELPDAEVLARETHNRRWHQTDVH